MMIRLWVLFFVLVGLMPTDPEIVREGVAIKLANVKHYYLHQEESSVKKIEGITTEDREWLALNIFHEARGENLHGRLAVAFVTLNRVAKKPWPDTIKGVVTQPFQFSWYNSKKLPVIKKEELKTFENCKIIADFAIDLYNSMAESEDFEVDCLTRGATHYYANYIQMPSWAKKMDFNAKIGTHLFYTGI